MHQFATRGLIAAAAVFAASGAVHAAPIFTWNPQSVGLHGSAVAADTLILGDDAQIVLGNGGTSFTDTGFLPVLGFTLGGQSVTPFGFNDPSGHGWGAFFHYAATGTQTLSPFGLPQNATFQQLSYEVVGFNGLANFGFGPDGAAVVGGPRTDVTTLELGSLIDGQLAFVPTSATAVTIEGRASVTLDDANPQFMRPKPDQLDVNFFHPPDQYSFTSPSTIRIAAGASDTASFSDADPPPVPEPASAVLLASALLGLAWGRRSGSI